MKILCDVCEKDEASVFCVADEASLCAACDHCVHHANKLAGKHHRFSLLHTAPKQAPLCDICQDRRAFLFCQQDRAILCKDCDVPIHKGNEHTRKHARFLLTGVRLSAISTLYSESAGSESSDGVVSKSTPSPAKSTTPETAAVTSSEKVSIPTSSISEYLMETLPGWHVEDLLDSSSPSFCQSGENELLPFWDGNFEKNTSYVPAEKMGMWVPQVPPPPPPPPPPLALQKEICFGLPNGYSSRKRSEDNSFAVPQISTAVKRSRTSFWEFA